MNPIRKALRAGFELVERPFDRLFGPSLNPLAQLGALGFFFFWIVAVSGIYLFIFFDTGIDRAYRSVEYISRDQWFHAGVMRSFHRYASDLMVVKRDFAFVLDQDIEAEKIVKAAKGADKQLISDVIIFDRFTGKTLDEGKMSLAIEVTIQPREKTLTEDEIEEISKKVVAQVHKATGGTLRS